MSPTRTLVALAVALAAQPTVAQESTSNLDLTVGAAVLFPGSIYVEPYNWDTGTGFGGHVALDYAVAPRLSAGLVLQYSATTLTEVDVDCNTTGVGASLKALFGDPKAWHFKAGVNLLYQLNSIDVPDADDATGLGVGLLVEVLKPLSPKVDLAGHLGFVTQPSGGNDSAEVTWGPILFLGAGVTFGL